jgi:16S rRNA processing protein RimM
MQKGDCYRIGRILKSFGYKGAMVISVEPDQAESYEKTEFLFIDIDNEVVPFFVEEFQVRDDHSAVVKLEDISSDDRVKQLINHELLIPAGHAVHSRSNSLITYGIEGYRVYDIERGYIGEVRQLISLNEQNLLQIFYRGKEILIPAVEEYLSGIDEKKKELYLKTPEGLLEIYL